MNHYANMIRNLKTAPVMEKLTHLYGSRDGMLVEQTARYTSVLKRHEHDFNTDREVLLISAPGRTEIGGNHTDHNRGRVLAAAVNLDALSAVSARDDMLVHLHSEGYRPLTVDLSDLSMREKELGTTAALIRGVAARMAELGYKIGGFDAAVTSSVASGSGLSSSAAFEVMVVAILDALYNGFVVVRNGDDRYIDNVVKGNERVLRSRLADAQFFYDEDKKTTLAEKAALLENVVFITKAGSYADKIARVKVIAGRLAQKVGFANVDELYTSISLMKADLVSSVVREYTEIQGVVTVKVEEA